MPSALAITGAPRPCPFVPRTGAASIAGARLSSIDRVGLRSRDAFHLPFAKRVGCDLLANL
jgi:hypothetical protein